MAGQLGLDPPTMTLCEGGIISELEQALLNSEAIADCFRCSISSSAISFVVYCSMQTVSLNRAEVQDQWEVFLEKLKKLHSAKRSVSEVFNPNLLFVLVPQLPRRCFPYFTVWSYFLVRFACDILYLPFLIQYVTEGITRAFETAEQLWAGLFPQILEY